MVKNMAMNKMNNIDVKRKSTVILSWGSLSYHVTK